MPQGVLTTKGSFAARAEEVVNEYAAPIEELDEEPLAERIVWLLADLMHLADREGLDWDYLEDQADTLATQGDD